MRPEDFAEIAEAAKSHGGRDLGDGPVIVLQQTLLQALVVQQRKIKTQKDVWISFDRGEKNGLPVSLPCAAGGEKNR